MDVRALGSAPVGLAVHFVRNPNDQHDVAYSKTLAGGRALDEQGFSQFNRALSVDKNMPELDLGLISMSILCRNHGCI